MTSMDMIQEVPAPLSHWYGQSQIADENAALLLNKRVYRRLETGGCWQFWAVNELKGAEKQLSQLNQGLAQHGIENLLTTFRELNEEANKLRLQMYNISQEFKRSDDEQTHEELRQKAVVLRENMAGIQQDRKHLMERLRPHRETIQERDSVAARIQEHYTSIAQEKEEIFRRGEMDKEARYIAENIILALNKLGFCHRRTKRDMWGNVTEVNEMIRFIRIISEPDKVILQVDISRLGLLGGHVNNLPTGVYAQDLVKEPVLIHLQSTLKLPVTSPNLTGEADWYDGIWYIVDRLGIADGLEKKIGYQAVMKHYPESKKKLMPVPMGVRSGRRINWINLVEQPHLLVNGVTGFGKSNAMQMFLSTLISKHSPDEVRFLIADMKSSGDFRWFLDLPHVIGFADEAEKALELTHALYLEMKRRQKLIKGKTNDIAKFNEMVNPADRLPHVVFIFDEYPAVTINPKLGKKIHEFSSHLAMQGRSTGIHMFPSGQQMYSDSFPRQLLANITYHFTARQNSVSGAMATTGSRETMKMKAIKGRFLCTSSHEHYQVQMPFIEDSEIETCCDMARRWPEPNYFALPEVPRDEDEEELTDNRSPEELVLEMALSAEFEGALKADQLWKALDGALSLNKVRDTVKQITSHETVDFEGKAYLIRKEPKRKYHRLIELEVENSEDEELEHSF